MKYDRFFLLAKEAGIEEAELYISTSKELTFSIFHGEIDKYSDNNGCSIIARGLINGKCGNASADSWSPQKAEYLVKEIKANAGVIECEDPQFIFAGSPKYKKINTFNKELAKVSIEEKMAKARQLEDEIRKFDKRITDVQEVDYEEIESTVLLYNSHKLKLSQKSNYFVYVAAAVAKQGEQVKSFYEVFLDNDFNKFNVNEFAKIIGSGAISQLGGEACPSSTYKTVLSPDVVRSFLTAYIASADAEEVQKQSSFFMNKLHEKVASNKVTVEDRPLQRNVFARWFDDEGVATYNKAIIKNGKLETYLYNLTTAAKESVETTANGHRVGLSIGTSPAFLYMKPGRKTQEELFREVGDGVYITDVSGLHAGLNPHSGNFSLQSSGYLIKNGKKNRGLDIITISGNLIELFKDVLEVGNDSKVSPSAVSCPSVLVKKLVVSGK